MLRLVPSPADSPASAEDERERLRAQARERDRALLTQAQAGDRAALGELLRQHGPVLFRTVLLPRAGSTATAEDVLSETYAKVVQSLASFQWNDNFGFYPWLRTIGLRTLLDHFRRHKRQVVWSEEELAAEIDREAEATGLDEALAQAQDAEIVRKKLHAALEALNPRYAEAIRLRVLDELPRDTVAERLGVSVATFDVLLHRALSSLKKQLAP